jgi:antitoxin ParD1/3/4
MARTTSFTLGEDLEEFVREKVESGAYSSASEVMRDSLRRMVEEERKERELLAALDAGLASRRTRRGVWERVDAKVRRSLNKR